MNRPVVLWSLYRKHLVTLSNKNGWRRVLDLEWRGFGLGDFGDLGNLGGLPNDRPRLPYRRNKHSGALVDGYNLGKQWVN